MRELIRGLSVEIGGGDQPRLGRDERRQHCADLLAGLAARHDLREPGHAARVGGAFSELHHRDERAPQDALVGRAPLPGSAPVHQGIGDLHHEGLDQLRRPELVQPIGEMLGPQPHQRELEQRERTHATLALQHEILDETARPRLAQHVRRPLDGLDELGLRHLRDPERLVAERVRKAAVRAERAGEVIAHREHHRDDAVGLRGGVRERGQERRARGLGRALREQLLELVDEHDHAGLGSAERLRGTVERVHRVRRSAPGVRRGAVASPGRGREPGQDIGQPLQRVRARPQYQHVGVARPLHGLADELREQPGAHQRGLPRARGPQDGKQARRLASLERMQPDPQPPHQVVAAEEQLAVGLAECIEPAVGVLTGGGFRGAQPGVRDDDRHGDGVAVAGDEHVAERVSPDHDARAAADHLCRRQLDHGSPRRVRRLGPRGARAVLWCAHTRCVSSAVHLSPSHATTFCRWGPSFAAVAANAEADFA